MPGRYPCPPDCPCGKHTPEFAAGVSARKKGTKLSAEQRAGISEFMRTRPHTPETRAKRSRAMTGKKLPPSPERLEQLREGIAHARQFSRFFNTKLEQKVRDILDDSPVGYRTQVHIAGHTVDFLLDDGSVLEVNGCYWHCCEQCGYEDRDDTRAKDKIKLQHLNDAGMTVKVLWEHDVMGFRVDGRSR